MRNESGNTSGGVARGMRESAACVVSLVDFGASGEPDPGWGTIPSGLRGGVE